MKITLICDGSCVPNPGPGGWGARCHGTIDGKPYVFEASGTLPDSTNNEMEMVAIREALQEVNARISEPCDILITTDSQLAITYLTGGGKELPHLAGIRDEILALRDARGHHIQLLKVSKRETLRAHQLAELAIAKIPAVPQEMM